MSDTGQTLLRTFLAIRGIPEDDSGLPRGTVTRVFSGELVRSPHRDTIRSLAKFMSRVAGREITEAQVLELARRRVRDPDRVSDEIQEALAAGAQGPE